MRVGHRHRAQPSARRLLGAGLPLPAACLACLGCAGGIHHAGEQQFALSGSFGHPIKGQAVWPDGKGRADNAAVTLGHNYFLDDRLAFMSALTPYRNYNQSDGDAYTGEFQLGLRYFFWELESLAAPAGFFAEIWGGALYGARSVPGAGSNFDFTQDTGLGVEVKLSDDVSWITGYRLRHLSNGNFFNDSNPAQNDHHMYTALAFSWN